MEIKPTFETIYDGTDCPVKTREGGTQIVKVRKVPIRQLTALAAVWDDEPKEVALYCDKGEDWVSQLTDESFEALIEEGRRLNYPSYAKWRLRRQQTEGLNAQSPVVKELLERALPSIEKVLRERMPLPPLPKSSSS